MTDEKTQPNPAPGDLELFRAYVESFDDDPVLHMAPDVIAELEWLRAENKRLRALRLTDDERVVLGNVANDAARSWLPHTERVVRGLLERMK